MELERIVFDDFGFKSVGADGEEEPIRGRRGSCELCDKTLYSLDEDGILRVSMSPSDLDILLKETNYVHWSEGRVDFPVPGGSKIYCREVEKIESTNEPDNNYLVSLKSTEVGKYELVGSKEYKRATGFHDQKRISIGFNIGDIYERVVDNIKKISN